MALLYVVAILGVMLGFVSLAVDLGRVQTAKTEARRTADAVARAAIAGLSTSISTAQSNATALATANTIDGSAVSLDTANDIEFGSWDTDARTFTVLTGAARSGANAVRVTIRCTAARGKAIPLLFAQALGQRTCDVTASAIASNTGSFYEMVGLDSVTVKNNLLAATYSSSSTTDPSRSTYPGNGGVGSNGPISAKNNEDVGGVILGPSGTSDLDTGTTTVLPSDIPWPTMPATPSSGTDVNITGTVTYGPGTYNWNNVSFANNSTLQFSGPATVNIIGDITFAQNATITASNSIPGNLTIYQYGNHAFGGSNSNSLDITADLCGPGSDFYCKNSATIRGRMFFKTIYAKNNLDFYYDTTLAPMYSGGAGGITTVK